MTSNDVLIALTRTGGPFCRRKWIAVPRVYWGWDLRYEADLIAISKSGYCTEVEIKVSRQDLRADRLKRKWEQTPDERISRFYYAVPEKMADYALSIIPESNGLISVQPGSDATSSLPVAKIVRKALKRDYAVKPTPEQVTKLLHLGLMRYWDLLIKEPA